MRRVGDLDELGELAQVSRNVRGPLQLWRWVRIVVENDSTISREAVRTR